jgi:chemotaxis protein MotB
MRESVPMLKEQLRIKTKELQNSNSEKAKHDAKIQHVLKISQDKIESLQKTVAEKDKEIISSRKSKTEEDIDTEKTKEDDQKTIFIKELQEDLDEAKESLEETKESLDKTKEEKNKLKDEITKLAENYKATAKSITKEIVEVKDPKLVQALKKLKLKNEGLKKRIDSQNLHAKQTLHEKELLAQELKNEQNQPSESNELKKKLKQQEEDQKNSMESLQKMIDEKTELIESFEKMISDAREGEDGSKLPAEIIKDLKKTLEKLGEEKEELDKDLKNYKKNFKKKLAEELKKKQEELDEQLKKSKQGQKKPPPVEEVEEGAPAWMATFSDMVTLMLVFFILMYAIASKNVQTFKSAIIGAEAKSIGVLEALNAVEMQEKMQHLKSEESDDILSGVREVAEDSEMSVETKDAKILIRIPGASLFKPGKADLELTARPLLDAVIKVVNKHPDYKIHIRGHTDDEQISTVKFPTNWELSAGRATAVLRYFVDRGAEPERMTATGYADTFPLGRNDTVPGRARNRRVEFVLEKEK